LETDDSILLNAYVRDGDGDAFGRLVERHTDFVYAAAMRQSGNGAAAQDITQAVFLLLSQRAGSVKSPGSLKGWLFTATRYVASAARRSEMRRARREKEAAAMRPEIGEEKESAGAVEFLDDALASLPEKYRQAVLLRYFEERPIAVVGQVLGISEDAAQKRVTRAIGRMRDFLSRREVKVTESSLPGVMAAEGARRAPAFLAKMTVQTVFKCTAGGSSPSISLAKGASHMMVRNQLKLVALKILAATVFVGGATAAVVTQESRPAAPVGAGPVVVAQAETETAPVADAEDPEFQACRGVLQGIIDAYEHDDLEKLQTIYYADPATGGRIMEDEKICSADDLAGYRVVKTAIAHFGTSAMGLFTRNSPIEGMALDVLARVKPEDMSVEDDWVVITPPYSPPGLWPHSPLYFKQVGDTWRLDIGESCRIVHSAARRHPVVGETEEQAFAASEGEMANQFNAIAEAIDRGEIKDVVEVQARLDQMFSELSNEYSRFGVNFIPR
jgi:RNA polymerase sigma factor (sigma-70 family)